MSTCRNPRDPGCMLQLLRRVRAGAVHRYKYWLQKLLRRQIRVCSLCWTCWSWGWGESLPLLRNFLITSPSVCNFCFHSAWGHYMHVCMLMFNFVFFPDKTSRAKLNTACLKVYAHVTFVSFLIVNSICVLCYVFAFSHSMPGYIQIYVPRILTTTSWTIRSYLNMHVSFQKKKKICWHLVPQMLKLSKTNAINETMVH